MGGGDPVTAVNAIFNAAIDDELTHCPLCGEMWTADCNGGNCS
jgi:hypothetical protein